LHIRAQIAAEDCPRPLDCLEISGMRREHLTRHDLLKPDLGSEVILTASGCVLFLPLLVLVVAAIAAALR